MLLTYFDSSSETNYSTEEKKLAIFLKNEIFFTIEDASSFKIIKSEEEFSATWHTMPFIISKIKNRSCLKNELR